MTVPRIGLLGGSFNPVHLGHLVMAEDALEHFALGSVLFVPAALPPHKTLSRLSDAVHRVSMLRLAIESNPRFDVEVDEIQRGGVSYSVDTVRRLQAKYPESRLHFIIGGDTLRELHTWKDVHVLLELCEFITIARPGFAASELEAAPLGLPDPWPSRLRANLVTDHLVEISSTDIRQRVARGLSIRHLVPPAVERYIVEHQLYVNQEGQS
jgi:nicotinate-nucleotide adenylyltransferase